VANGLDEKRTLEQIKKIHAANAKHLGIRILASSEVDVLKSGKLDLDDEVLAQLDVVLVSIHSYMTLERAEMTARIVDVEYQKLYEGLAAESEPDVHQWMAVLQSVAAYEIYRREYHSRIDPERVAELLILHPQHPRSIRFSIATLQQSLRAISGAGPDSYANEAERLTGKLHETLMYDRIEEIFARGLHGFLEDLQKTCKAIGEHIARTYFYYAVVE